MIVTYTQPTQPASLNPPHYFWLPASVAWLPPAAGVITDRANFGRHFEFDIVSDFELRI